MNSPAFITHSKPFVSLVFIALLLLTTQSPAGVFYLLISADDGIETVDEIFEEFNQGTTPQTLLTIFNDYPPESVEYLYNFNRPVTPPTNPDSTSGRQYRRLLVSYPYPLGVTEVMDYFQSSPLIETASYDGNLEPIIFTPESPMAGDEVLLDIVLFPEFCGHTIAVAANPQGLISDLNLSGNNLILDVSYQTYPPGQPVICFGDRPSTQFNLGQLTARTYQIQVNLVGHNTLFPANNSDRQHLTDVTLVVQGDGTTIVPVDFLNLWSSLLLMIGIFALTFGIRKRI